MRAVDVGATVGADGVLLTVPAVQVLVSRENAERLRDALSTVLPVQIDLEHDPRVSDVQVLRAARSLLGERSQDTENLAVAIDHIERDAAMTAGRAATQGGTRTAEDRPRRYLLNLWGDVEPELSGPFKDERDRIEAAQDYRRAHGPEDGLFRVDGVGQREGGHVHGRGACAAAAPLRAVPVHRDARGPRLRGVRLPRRPHRG